MNLKSVQTVLKAVLPQKELAPTVWNSVWGYQKAVQLLPMER